MAVVYIIASCDCVCVCCSGKAGRSSIIIIQWFWHDQLTWFWVRTTAACRTVQWRNASTAVSVSWWSVWFCRSSSTTTRSTSLTKQLQLSCVWGLLLHMTKDQMTPFWAGLWSRSPPESGFWHRVGVSHLKETPRETPTPGPVCLIWTCVILLLSVWLLCNLFYS